MTLVSTPERAGEYDAIETAKPGEPLFSLQGGDPFAPACILLWAQLAREAADRLTSEVETTTAKRRIEKLAANADKLRRKATAAEEVAWAMQEYQRGDVVAPVAEAEDGDEVQRGAIAALSAICDRIYNSEAELTEAADALHRIGGHDVATSKLRDAAIAAGLAVRAAEPRRHLQGRAA